MITNYKENLINIKAFIFDVDGVLTDGKLLITDSGELLRSMNVKDGFAMKFAIDNGFKIGIISGGTNEAVKSRLMNLGIEEIHLKSHNKIIHFENFSLFDLTCAIKYLPFAGFRIFTDDFFFSDL